MIFGAVPIRQAKGGILAHSISLKDRRLRKGITLGDEDIERLEASGLREVVVARLEANDVQENQAAADLAKALVPDSVVAGLERTAAFTGRVNLVATGPGVVVQDIERLIALNSIDPMISFATVSNYQQMHKGGLVGTIKIISYAVNEEKLRSACALGAAAVKLMPPKLKTASLLVSQNGNRRDDKGISAIQARLEALDINLEKVMTTDHDLEQMTNALGSLSSDLLLVLTSSATSDLNDIAPSAVRAVGGRIDRFGIPVDPGNLLFLGHIKTRPVIGFPGCVRSPALNGADWVLSRIACGVSIDDASFAQMAVGGLLKEIPTRPQPRRPNR